MDNVSVPVFKKKKVVAMAVAAAKRAVKKLLTVLTNTILEKERRDMQDMSVKKI